jgi:opacity protein-like surface antigen
LAVDKEIKSVRVWPVNLIINIQGHVRFEKPTKQEEQKMSTKWFVFAVAAVLAGSSFAADKESNRVTPNLDKGTKVLEGAGIFNVMGDELQLQLAYGQFVTDGFEVALVAGLRDSDRYMSTELGVRAEYNFVFDSPLVPFLGAGVVWADAEADDSDIDADAAVFSAGGGVKYFIRDDVALAVDGSYLVATDDIFLDSEENEVQDDEFRILFSVRYYFD